MNYSPPRIPFFVDTDVSGKGRHGLQTKSGTYCGFLPNIWETRSGPPCDPGHRKQRQKGHFSHRYRCIVTDRLPHGLLHVVISVLFSRGIRINGEMISKQQLSLHI